MRWQDGGVAGLRHGGRQPLRLQLVHVWERSAPEGVEALEWFLLTTLAGGVAWRRRSRCWSGTG